MSRRCHHGSPRHLRQVARERRRGPLLAERPPIAPADRPLDVPPEERLDASNETVEPSEQLDADAAPEAEIEAGDSPGIASSMDTGAAAGAAAEPAPVTQPATDLPTDAASMPDPAPSHARSRAVAMPTPVRARPPEPRRVGRQALAGVPPTRLPHGPREAGPDADAGPGEPALERGATAPQLRRFIKSRAYVPLHELRRRFAINGGDDDVIPIDVDRQRVYVGLPPREGSLLGELLRAGDIGYELSLDPIAPIVVGVYPMRPVPRS